MRKWILGLFALALAAAPLHAGGFGPMFAHWDTKDADDDQGGGVRLTVDLGRDWNLELRGSWLDGFLQVGDGILFRIEATPIDVGLSYGFDTGGSVEPYVGAGVSYVLTQAEAIDSEIRRQIEVVMPDEVGPFLMAGLDIPVNARIGVFVEALYRSVKSNANSTDIRDFASDLSGLGANAGVVLRF